MSYEQERDYVESTRIRHTPDKGAKVSLEAWVAITLSGTVVFGVVVAWVLWVLNTYPIVKTVFVCVTAAIPILGIVMCCMKLYEQWCKITGHETVPIGQWGTAFRTRRGKIQVVSPDEVFALESVDATRTPIVEPLAIDQHRHDTYEDFVRMLERSLGKPLSEVPLSTLADLPTQAEMERDRTSFPPSFQMEAPYYAPYEQVGKEEGTEEGTEVYQEVYSLDDAAILMHSEALASKKALELQKREQTKQRIRTLHNAGMNITRIAKQIGMTGGSYAKFRELCEEVGIDTSEM